MAVCEKCWKEAEVRTGELGKSVTHHYLQVLEERKNNPCTPEEQCGDLHVGKPNCKCKRYKIFIEREKE